MSKNHRAKRPVLRVAISGMHCASCEVLTEQRLRTVPGVESVKVSQPAGRADITYSVAPSLAQLQEALAGTEYAVSTSATPQPKAANHIETVWAFGIVLALYFILNWLRLVPKGLSVGGNMSYGFVFLIGLVAAVSSCIAVTGGLLVAAGSRYAETHPGLSGWQTFRPMLHFNVGRVVGYTLFGGLIGLLGSAFAISTRMTGVLSVAASLVMVFLGLQLLDIFPGLRRFQPAMPKVLAHRIHESAAGPFFLGAATFFLPCGFTQALQLYVLSKGSFEVGALTMLAFSLGTMPALLSLGALSSFLKGVMQRRFFKVAGAVVVVLGLTSIGNGLVLAGFNVTLSSSGTQTTEPGDLQTAQLVDGKQVINMEVVNYTYIPAHFKVVQGVPVEWHVDGTKAAGCAGVLEAPDLNVTASLPDSEEKVVAFTPEKTGTYRFSCPMGMTTRSASIEVVPSGDPATVSAVPVSSPVAAGESQRFTLTYTSAGGFSPKRFVAKAGVPVDLTVDIQGALGGCMSTMIGSDYGIVARLHQGANTVRFTPTKAGTVKLTCPMGIPMGSFEVGG